MIWTADQADKQERQQWCTDSIEALCLLLWIARLSVSLGLVCHGSAVCSLSLSAGSVKTLHLFEARYLSLLDDVLAQPGSNKVFAHVVIEQQGDTFGDTAAAFIGALNVDGYVFVMASLVRVSE